MMNYSNRVIDSPNVDSQDNTGGWYSDNSSCADVRRGVLGLLIMERRLSASLYRSKGSLAGSSQNGLGGRRVKRLNIVL